jgi:hypothetical protein
VKKTGTVEVVTDTPGEDPQVTAAKIAATQAQAEADAENQRRKQLTEGAVKSAFHMYGLDSLFPLVSQYAQMGLTEDEIILNLRSTPEYNARFPAMATLSKEGRAITEGAYIDYERQAAELEQRYGFPKGMVMGSVTDLLIADIGGPELQDRLILASADSLTAPDDLKNQLSQFYGVESGEALRAYYLDPEKALPILQKQSASARIATQATRAGAAGISKSLAEELQGLGVSEEKAQQGFGKVVGQAGLSAGKGDVATTDTLIDANLKDSANAQGAAMRAGRSRVGRFQGGGGYVGNQKGISGLASSST